MKVNYPHTDKRPGPRASRPHFSDTRKRPAAPKPHRAWHHRGYLPHFDAGAVVQMITFRLADSLPRELYEKISASTENDDEKRRRLEDDRFAKGTCILRDPEIAAIVAASLKHFDGTRYRLTSWVIMPNHLHVLIEQIDGFPLSDIVRGWKSFTAKQINKFRKTRGPIWAPDYFDRFIRNRRHFSDAVAYIENNPKNAGLTKAVDEWAFSSSAGNAGETPAVPALSGLL